MTEIGIERLGAGNHEEHGAERKQPDIPVGEEETHAMKRIECREHAQILRDMPYSADGEHDEPYERDGSEERCHSRGAPRLHREQAK
jgi:hypothetical protein